MIVLLQFSEKRGEIKEKTGVEEACEHVHTEETPDNKEEEGVNNVKSLHSWSGSQQKILVVRKIRCQLIPSMYVQFQ